MPGGWSMERNTHLNIGGSGAARPFLEEGMSYTRSIRNTCRCTLPFVFVSISTFDVLISFWKKKACFVFVFRRPPKCPPCPHCCCIIMITSVTSLENWLLPSPTWYDMMAHRQQYQYSYVRSTSCIPVDHLFVQKKRIKCRWQISNIGFSHC